MKRREVPNKQQNLMDRFMMLSCNRRETEIFQASLEDWATWEALTRNMIVLSVHVELVV